MPQHPKVPKLMRPITLAFLLIGLLSIGSPAFASTPGEGELIPERMASPQLGVKPTLHQGLFADLQVGTFFTMNTDSQRVGAQVSNAQPYVGVGMGYDITRNVVAGLTVGFGASAGPCFDPDYSTGQCRGVRSFSVFLINAQVGYLHELDHQWYVGGKVLGGGALMTPGPVESDGGDLLVGYNAGLALTTEYHTHLEHFVLGLDVAATLVMGGARVQFPSFAIYPRLKYVF